MNRAKRLEPVEEMADEAERESAMRVAAAQGRLTDAERRCGDLRRYLLEYQSMFRQRASGGIGASGMRDYQTFIARLAEAVRTQEILIAQLRRECEGERERWVAAAARKQAVQKVIANALSEEQKVEELRMQKELDEHAQRPRGVL